MQRVPPSSAEDERAGRKEELRIEIPLDSALSENQRPRGFDGLDPSRWIQILAKACQGQLILDSYPNG